MTYFLAPALQALRAEVDRAFPNRDRTSDGWIGDASHAARVSDHNPCWSCGGRSNGIVRAIDVDSDGAPGQVTPVVAAVLRAAIGDPRVWYVIFNGKIYSRTYGWSPRVYTGSNPHAHHVHVSLNGANGIPGDPGNFDTRPWGVGGTKPAPNPTALSPVRLSAMRRAIAAPRRAVHPVQTRRVQRALNARGARLTVDGIYGPATRRAYTDWQRRLGFRGRDADGLPGRTSLSRLGSGRFRVIP